MTGGNFVAYGDLAVFSGNAHPTLAQEICNYLKIPLGKSEAFKFSNDNTFVRVLENVRQRDVYIVQPTVFPVNDNIMEMLIFIDAVKRASAGRITAVLPYYSYARTDKKDQPRVPITGRLVADLIETAGADRVLTMDLHAGQVQGFFSVPVDELTALPKLANYFLSKELKNLVVVATDIGISKRARDLAAKLEAPLAIIEKRRTSNNDRAEGLNIIGEVGGMRAVLFDDEISTGGTMLAAVELLKKGGALEVYACATHGVLPGEASHRLSVVPEMIEVVVTDTVPMPEYKKTPKIKVLTVSDLLGEAIYRIHNGMSVGALFT